METRFKFGDRVRVRSGFYVGREGYIYEYSVKSDIHHQELIVSVSYLITRIKPEMFKNLIPGSMVQSPQYDDANIWVIERDLELADLTVEEIQEKHDGTDVLDVPIKTI